VTDRRFHGDGISEHQQRKMLKAPAAAAYCGSSVSTFAKHAPRPGRHSEKPVVFYETIERMYPGLPRIELFARAVRPGSTAWGNEVPEN
jgi:N6-adenosine-specific RNA methylase IME4